MRETVCFGSVVNTSRRPTWVESGRRGQVRFPDPLTQLLPFRFTKIETTVHYLGVEVEDALALAEGIDI